MHRRESAFDLLYNQAGVDGLFTDFPDKAVQFLNAKR
jgi:glycerophosphoryl diester phosphodiesterase